jgi:hypothetical protein
MNPEHTLPSGKAPPPQIELDSAVTAFEKEIPVNTLSRRTGTLTSEQFRQEECSKEKSKTAARESALLPYDLLAATWRQTRRSSSEVVPQINHRPVLFFDGQ